jgi:hypothetical protein
LAKIVAKTQRPGTPCSGSFFVRIRSICFFGVGGSYEGKKRMKIVPREKQRRDEMNAYQLHVKVEGEWEWICTVDAETHPEAFRKAMLCLESRHYDKQIKLEQEAPGGEGKRKPCAPRT